MFRANKIDDDDLIFMRKCEIILFQNIAKKFLTRNVGRHIQKRINAKWFIVEKYHMSCHKIIELHEARCLSWKT